jgi:membrane protease YdiL (CAAX protease family)
LTSAVVFAVALWSDRGRRVDLLETATQFALSSSGLMTAAVISAAVFLSVAFVSARSRGRDVGATLRLGRTRASTVGLVSAVSGMAGLSLAAGSACDLLGWQGHGNMAAIAHALERPSALRLAAAIITIAIGPAVAEESLFRGLMQTRLAARWGRWPSIVATAACFGFIHLDLAQGCVAFVAGLFLGWLAERFGGIRPGILAHAFNNATFITVASLGSGGDATRTGAHLMLAFGTVVCASSIALLRSRFALGPPTDQNPTARVIARDAAG